LSADNQVEFRKALTYFDSGLLKDEQFYDRGLLTKTIVHTYNERGLLAESINHDLQSDLKSINRYTYDLAGNQIMDETLRNGQITFKNHCLYDDRNNLIEERVMIVGENTIEVHRHDITYW
jgi:hypothetical protein